MDESIRSLATRNRIRPPRTVEEWLDRTEARARGNLRRELREFRRDAAQALDERLVRRHPLLAVGLAAGAGTVTAWALARLARSPARALSLAALVARPWLQSAAGARGVDLVGGLGRFLRR